MSPTARMSHSRWATCAAFFWSRATAEAQPCATGGPSLSTSTAPDGPQGFSKVSCLSFVLVAAGRPAGAEPLWAGHWP
jgi:hypothetical protein